MDKYFIKLTSNMSIDKGSLVGYLTKNNKVVPLNQASRFNKEQADKIINNHNHNNSQLAHRYKIELIKCKVRKGNTPSKLND